jgi:hypothetical protein
VSSASPELLLAADRKKPAAVNRGRDSCKNDRFERQCRKLAPRHAEASVAGRRPSALERDEHVAEWIWLADGVSTQVAQKIEDRHLKPPRITRGKSGGARRATKIAALSDEAKTATVEEGFTAPYLTRGDSSWASIQASI